MSLLDTPRASRLHIGIYGKRNSGKSTLINALTNQPIALVSDIAGTTTDPVYKTMEIPNIGPCVFIDTAGFDDEGPLGEMRIAKTKEAMQKTDIAIILFTDLNITEEINWLHSFKALDTPVIPVINKADLVEDINALSKQIKKATHTSPLIMNAKEKKGVMAIYDALIDLLPKVSLDESMTSDLVKTGDLVLLVMPQDNEAPKGRLILPQVQTIRDLLDKQCLIMSCTPVCLEQTLASLVRPPDLIITDSQAFKEVYAKKPPSSKLTSFSILLAKYKGDIHAFIKGAKMIDTLNANAHILIAEACTHASLHDDIARDKIPQILRKKISPTLNFEVVSGSNFPTDLTKYDLIIHCGGCMFNRKYMLSRIHQANLLNVPITNYGIALAHLNGILNDVSY